MGKFCLVTSHISKAKIRKMPVKGLYGNQNFHVPFRFMIYVALKFTLQVSEIELNIGHIPFILLPTKCVIFFLTQRY